jgi:monoterpene epsilon-lactone hydrolase
MQPATMDGVRVYIVMLDVIAPEHRDKLLIHVHGGC